MPEFHDDSYDPDEEPARTPEEREWDEMVGNRSYEGFTPAAKEFLKDIPRFDAQNTAQLFEGYGRFLGACTSYAELFERLLDKSDEMTTPTEVYLYKAIAEGFIVGDFDHVTSQLEKLKTLKTTGAKKPGYFLPEQGLWWPSISEHYWAIDYYPKLESFTQLSALFAGAHADPEAAKRGFERLKEDPLLYDKEKGLWISMKLACDKKPTWDSEVYLSRDQLLAAMITSFYNREEARSLLERFESSDLVVNGECLYYQSEKERYEDKDPRRLDQLLLVMAKFYCAEPHDRMAALEESKNTSSSFNKENGHWNLSPLYEYDKGESNQLLVDFVGIILERLTASK